jgi:hypothetical protein
LREEKGDKTKEGCGKADKEERKEGSKVNEDKITRAPDDLRAED